MLALRLVSTRLLSLDPESVLLALLLVVNLTGRSVRRHLFEIIAGNLLLTMHFVRKFRLEPESHALVNLLSKFVSFLDKLLIFLLLLDESSADAWVLSKDSRRVLLRIALVNRLILSSGRVQRELMRNRVAGHCTVVVWVHMSGSSVGSSCVSCCIGGILSQVSTLGSSVYIAHVVVRIRVVGENWLMDLHQVLQTVLSILMLRLQLAVVSILVGQCMLTSQIEMGVDTIAEVLLSLKLVVIVVVDVSNEITVVLAVVERLEVRVQLRKLFLHLIALVFWWGGRVVNLG